MRSPLKTVPTLGAAPRKLFGLTALGLPAFSWLAVVGLACPFVSAARADEPLRDGVRAVIPRAPAGVKMKMDGDLSPFKDAFCSPVEFFHPDRKNRPAQFFYMWDDEAFYAGLRTLDEEKKQANPSSDDMLWGGDAVEWYFDTRRGADFRGMKWGPGAVHCYWTGLTGKELMPRFCLRPGYLDAIPKTGVQVASRRWKHGLEVEFKLPWVNFPKFKPRPGEVIGLDAEACYSDGGPRVFRSFAFGCPLSVDEPAMLAKVQLVERFEAGHWRQCGPQLMPMRVDVPWSQKTKPLAQAQIAVPPNLDSQVGRVVFRVLDLAGKTLAEHEAADREPIAADGNFAVLSAHWPVDEAPPAGHQVIAIVYDRSGTELTRVAPRLLSVNNTFGY